MIIPTLRICSQDLYASMVRCYCKQNIQVLRVNMVRHSMERYCTDIKYINKVSDYPFQIMADIPLPGNKYRLNLPNEKEINIRKGQEIQFSAESRPLHDAIPVMIDTFGNIAEGSKIVIGDGEVTLTVKKSDNKTIIASANNSATIRGQRSFAIPGSLSYEKYDSALLQSYINAFYKIRPSKIVLSFSEDLEVLETIKRKIEKHLGEVLVIPKIETQLGVDNCSEICSAFNEIMLGRGDLALFSNPIDFGKNQRQVILDAKRKGTNVIAATDILTSLYDHHIPSRSDLSDIYYLYEMGIKDIVASAGISMNPEWFEMFCMYALKFK